MSTNVTLPINVTLLMVSVTTPTVASAAPVNQDTHQILLQLMVFLLVLILKNAKFQIHVTQYMVNVMKLKVDHQHAVAVMVGEKLLTTSANKLTNVILKIQLMHVTHTPHAMTLMVIIPVLVLQVSLHIMADEILMESWAALILTNVKPKLFAQPVTPAMKMPPVLITLVHTTALVMMVGPVMDTLAPMLTNARTIPTHVIQMLVALITMVAMNVHVTLTQDSWTVPNPVNVSINVKHHQILLDAKIFPSQAISNSSMPSHVTKTRSASQARTGPVFPSVPANTHLDLRFEMASV